MATLPTRHPSRQTPFACAASPSRLYAAHRLVLRSSVRARWRRRSSSAAMGTPVVLVANAVSRRPSVPCESTITCPAVSGDENPTNFQTPSRTSARADRIAFSLRTSRGQMSMRRETAGGAVHFGAGRFELRRPSSVRLASAAQHSRGPTTSGRWRRARRRSGLADKGQDFWFRGCIRRPMGHPPGPPTRTALRGAPPLREKLVSSSGRQKAKAERSLSRPLLTYSALGGLRQDPGGGAKSSAEATTCGKGARRACVVDVWGTR